MKAKLVLSLLVMIAVTSCTITKRRYTGGWHVEWNKRIHASHDSGNQVAFLQSDTLTASNEARQEIAVFPNEQQLQLNETTLKKDTLRSKTRSKSTLKRASDRLSHHPADTVKRHKKWVPYKYRKQQEEAEERERASNGIEEPEEPSTRSALEMAGVILGVLALIYFGYGTAVLLAAFCLAIYDFTVTVTFWAYLSAFLVAWIVFAGVTFLILSLCIQNSRKSESRREFRKRLWRYSMLIAIGLALITVIVLGVVMFL